MAEECEGQSGLAADAAEPLVDDLLGLADGVETEVGQLPAFQGSSEISGVWPFSG